MSTAPRRTTRATAAAKAAAGITSPPASLPVARRPVAKKATTKASAKAKAAAPKTKKAAAAAATEESDDDEEVNGGDNDNSDSDDETVVPTKAKPTTKVATPTTTSSTPPPSLVAELAAAEAAAKPSGIPVRAPAKAKKAATPPVAEPKETKTVASVAPVAKPEPRVETPAVVAAPVAAVAKKAANGTTTTAAAKKSAASPKKPAPAKTAAATPAKIETKAAIAPGSDSDSDNDVAAQKAAAALPEPVHEIGTSSDFPVDASGSDSDDGEGDDDEEDGDGVVEDSNSDDSDDEKEQKKKPTPAASASPAKKTLLFPSSSSTSSATANAEPVAPTVGSISDESSATSHRGFYLTEIDLENDNATAEPLHRDVTPEARAAREAFEATLERKNGKKIVRADKRVPSLAEEEDSSDDEGGMMNRIGGVPLEWYDNYDHIGYDVHGKKIARPAGGDTLDRLLARVDNPNFSRTINDPLNAKQIILSDEELAIINRIRKGQVPHSGMNQYPDYEDWFTSQKEVEALGNPQEPKARFVPSKHEARIQAKLVNAMLNGWIKMPSMKAEEDAKRKEEEERGYLMWAQDGHAIDQGPGRSKPPSSIPPPKPALPGHNESYNPPPEYLPTQDEKEKYEAMEPEERPQFLPTGHDALREVGAYHSFIKERFERCLDLYLCPRVKRTPKRIDPESLIPNLPKPSELKPFPSQLCLEYKGHTHRIRSISVSPDGQWLASGSDDGTVRIWEVSTGRCFRRYEFKQQGDVIDCVAWHPNPDLPLLAAAVGTRILLLHTHTGSEEQKIALEAMLTNPIPDESKLGAGDEAAGQTAAKARAAAAVVKNVAWGLNNKVDTNVSTDPNPQPPADPLAVVDPATLAAATALPTTDGKKSKRKANGDANGAVDENGEPEVKWSRGVIETNKRVKQIVWHSKGDYFATFSPESSATSILIHRLSRNKTQTPFSKSKGLVQSVLFHPSKPFFFVASQRNIRVYNLAQEQLVKKLTSPAKWISSMVMHPSGDHLLIGSYDRKLCWYDLDYSSAPFKSLKYHKKAVRSVAYHPRYPLFASASDDGKLHIFHGMVYSDLLTPPMIVPVKILHAHQPVEDLGVMHTMFHPTQPWIFSAGADHAIRLFV